jgi:1-acyl-sn-glycerol-3-phosphate acyltransferase
VERERGGFWVGFAAVFCHVLTAALARRREHHAERLPARGGALLVLNHLSHLDPFYDAVLVHGHGRVPRFMGKHSLWRIPLAGALLRACRQIPVYRGTADAGESLRAAHASLANGEVVVIYPEGTITRDPDGWPGPSRTGVARLALAHDVPVVPIARWGTLDVYDHYRKRFRPLPRKTVVTVVGEPVDLSAHRGRTADADLLHEVTDLLMNRVTTLLAEVRGQEPPDGFPRSGPTGTSD